MLLDARTGKSLFEFRLYFANLLVPGSCKSRLVLIGERVLEITNLIQTGAVCKTPHESGVKKKSVCTVQIRFQFHQV